MRFRLGNRLANERYHAAFQKQDAIQSTFKSDDILFFYIKKIHEMEAEYNEECSSDKKDQSDATKMENFDCLSEKMYEFCMEVSIQFCIVVFFNWCV